MTFTALVPPEGLILCLVSHAFPKGNSYIAAFAARKAGGADQLFNAFKFRFYTYTNLFCG